MEQLSLLENSITTAKPFIKWAGGKQALTRQLIQYFPTDFDTYYEPFIGGGSIFFGITAKKAVIADYNTWLIDTYTAIQKNWIEVATILDSLPNDKESYLQIRAMIPETLSFYERAAHFIYLNKTCFRGLFRVNRKGMFNVPYGKYDRRYYNPINLRNASIRLNDTTIRQGDFELNVYGVSPNDFIYFDPPYYKLGGHSDFNRYTDKQFRENDQIRLAALCVELDKNGIRWALSNSNTDFIKRLYDGFNFHVIDARREINLNSKSRNIKEYLITNY